MHDETLYIQYGSLSALSVSHLTLTLQVDLSPLIIAIQSLLAFESTIPWHSTPVFHSCHLSFISQCVFFALSCIIFLVRIWSCPIYIENTKKSAPQGIKRVKIHRQSFLIIARLALVCGSDHNIQSISILRVIERSTTAGYYVFSFLRATLFQPLKLREITDRCVRNPAPCRRPRSWSCDSRTRPCDSRIRP